jgi:Flp pilus assembly protein TadG
MSGLALGAMAFGTTMQVKNQLQQGKDAQKLANARAAIDMQNAIDARNQAVEKAKITAERGRELLATQRSKFAAAGVLNNIDSPLVMAAKTQNDITKDIGFILETGRMESANYRASAVYEKASGKMARKQSKWNALASGASGFGSLAYMGYESGMFNKRTTSAKLNKAADAGWNWAGN